MNQFLVVEFRIWLLLVLVVVLAGLVVGAVFWARHRLAKHDAKLREEARLVAERDALAKRNSLLIRLDHELKNPLTALRTSAASVREMMRDEHPDPAEVLPAVRQIDTSSRRVARLLADLRKLADVESRTIDFAPVDMDRLVHQAVEDARTAPGAEDRMIVATVARAPWKLPYVAGEEDLMLSAILNLLNNAIKYSADTDVVELRANEQVINNFRWVVIEVADTGSGIPAEEQETVWDELSRGKQVRAVAGSGMGLALVRSIIARHGGSVELFSQVGVGTSVRLILPVLDDSQIIAPAGGQQGDHGQPAGPVHAVGPVSPPRNPDQARRAGQILGTPRRTSQRRLQKVDGQLHDVQTGEPFGVPTGAEAAAGKPVPFDSGPYQHFKPPHVPPNTPQSGGQVPGAQVSGGQMPPSGAAQYGSGPQQYGSGPAQFGSGPQQYGSGPQNPAAARNMNAAPQQYGSGPQQYGSGPQQYGSGPQQYGSGPAQYGSGPAQYGSGPRQVPPNQQVPPNPQGRQVRPGQQNDPARSADGAPASGPVDPDETRRGRH